MSIILVKLLKFKRLLDFKLLLNIPHQMYR